MVFRTTRKSRRSLTAAFVVFALTAHALAAPFEFGEIIADGGLQLAPVYRSDSAISGPLLGLAQAFADGQAQIRETGNVNSLEIENLSDHPLILLGGEIVEGGLQDRAIASDIVVPPKSSVRVGAFCVEKGRWSPLAGSDNSQFRPSGVFLDGDARAAGQSGGAAQSNQLAVWEQVSKALSSLGVEAPTGNYREVAKSGAVIANRERGTHFKQKIADDRRAIGLAVAYRGVVQKIETFAAPDLFATYRDQLIDSYVVAASKEPPGRLVAEADLVAFANAFVGDKPRETVFPGGKCIETEGPEIALFELLDANNRVLHYLKLRLPSSSQSLTVDGESGPRAYALMAVDAASGRGLPDCTVVARPPSKIVDMQRLKDGTGKILISVSSSSHLDSPVIDVSSPIHETKWIVLDAPTLEPLVVRLDRAVFRFIW